MTLVGSFALKWKAHGSSEEEKGLKNMEQNKEDSYFWEKRSSSLRFVEEL